jgi:hypothetical protein
MNPEPTQQQVVQAVYGFAAQMMRDGSSHYQIEKALMEKGLNAESARVVVDNLSRMRNDAVRNAAFKSMAIGGIICVIGIVVTLGSYSAASASPSGGSYVVAWGAVVFGGLQFFRGLMQYLGG